MARRIEVEIVGDSRSLERAFARSERSAKSFNQQMSRQGRATSAVFSSMNARFGAAAAGAGALALIKSSIDATREAEVVLGQTSIAVQDAGLSWGKYAADVDKASQRISKASAFDDEAVLQSFQVFVRGQKDVQRSLQLSELAADVARGRYTDLETATNLVNKAAMGQIGALRRAGIAIDKNATSAEALDALLRAYGGSAQKYADSAAGSADKLRVAWENLAEQAGGPLSSGLADVADYLTTIVEMGQKAGAIKLPSLPGLGGGGTLGNLAGKIGGYLLMPGLAPVRITKEIIDRIRGGGSPKPGDPNFIGPVKPPGFGSTGFAGFPNLGGTTTAKKKAAAGPVGISAEQRNQWFDAMIGRELVDVQDISTLKGQIARLKEISGQITARIAVTKDITRKLNLEDQVKDIARMIRGDQEGLAADAKRRGDAALAAAKDAAEKARQVAEAVKAAALAAKEAAAAAAAAARDAAREKSRRTIDLKMGWLDFALEQAEATTGTADDLRALHKREAFLKSLIAYEGRTLDRVRELWRTRQKILDLNKNQFDAMKGYRQVSSHKFVEALGLNISGTDQRRLQIALAQLGPRNTLPTPTGQGSYQRGGVTITGPVHLHGVQDLGQFEDQLTKRSKARPHVRRGAS